MEKGKVIIIYGNGKGKTSSAIGKGIKNLGAGKSVNMIQFLKGSRENAVLDVLKKLEPDMKVFRFEKHMTKFSDLSDTEKEEELVNINNGKNFARKVLSTGSCDMLILDEILGLVDRGIMSQDELVEFIRVKPDEMDLIITGRVLCEGVRTLADEIYRIDEE